MTALYQSINSLTITMHKVNYITSKSLLAMTIGYANYTRKLQ
jgi:hypothetical protein